MRLVFLDTGPLGLVSHPRARPDATEQFVRRNPNMATAQPTVSPYRSVDARGRALPMTEEEIRQRNEAAIRALDSLDEIGDEEEQRETLEYLIKAIDEEPLSDRKRFR